MDNVLFYFAGYPVYSFGFALGIGLFFASLAVIREGKRKGIGTRRTSDFVVGAAVAFLVGGQLVSGLQEVGLRLLLRPWLLLTGMEQGVNLIGGVSFAAIYLLLFVFSHNLILSVFLDAVSPGIPLLVAIGQLGSNVYGRASEAAWAVDFGQIQVHPVQLYSALGYYTVFALLWRSRRNIRFDGQLFLGFLALASWLELVLTMWRESGGVSLNPWVNGIVAVALSALWLALFINSPLSPYRRRGGILARFLAFIGYLLVVLVFVSVFYWRVS